MATQTAVKNEIVITRYFDAPQDLVWQAWTDPQLFKQWWGPKDFTAPFCRIDLRVGGKYLYAMRGPDGKEYWSSGVYREIVPNEKLVATDYFSDEKGYPIPASRYGLSPDFPMELQVIVTLGEYAGKTKMTLQYIGVPEGEPSDQTRDGWNQSFDKLNALLEDRVLAVGLK
jgi:uncharacterized protein YndB with AHSA1/START domain